MANPTRNSINARKSVKNIRKITRTMELIATARFKQSDGPCFGSYAVYTRPDHAVGRADLTKTGNLIG